MIIGHFWKCKKWNLAQKNREIDLFDLTNFFGLDFFLIFLAHCALPLFTFLLNCLFTIFSGVPRSGSTQHLFNSDPWSHCLIGFLHPDRLPSLCPSAVLHSWPTVHTRLTHLFTVVDPAPVTGKVKQDFFFLLLHLLPYLIIPISLSVSYVFLHL